MVTLKLIHVIAVTVSLCGFAVRGIATLAGSSLLDGRAVRVLPHVVDTVLLVSGVALAVSWRINPVEQPWLAAKLLALPLYIVCGAFALGRAHGQRARAAWFAMALLSAGFIVGAALHHSPWSWLATLPG